MGKKNPNIPKAKLKLSISHSHFCMKSHSGLPVENVFQH